MFVNKVGSENKNLIGFRREREREEREVSEKKRLLQVLNY